MRPDRRIVFVATYVVAAAAIAAGARADSRDDAQAAVLRDSAARFTSAERSEVARLSAAIDVLAADAEILAKFRARDREGLLALARPKFAVLSQKQGITHWYFLEPPPAKTCFLRVHKPEVFGDKVERDTFALAIKTGRAGSGKELGKTAFALRVVKPIRIDGKIIGYMELGEEIGEFLARVKARTGDDYGIFVHKERVDREELAKVRHEDRWNERPDVVLVESTMWNEQYVKFDQAVETIPDSGLLLGRWQDGTSSYVAMAFPFRNPAGVAIGAVVVRHRVPGT